MATEFPPFLLQPVLSELYQPKDLLDLSAPGPSSPPWSATTSPAQPATTAPTSIFSSATSIAAAAGRRAAAVASAAASPHSQASPSIGGLAASPDRARAVLGQTQAGPPQSDQAKEIRCVEGYGPNLYIGGSDGVVEWWTCDGAKDAKNGWTMRHRYTVFPRRPISKVVLLPKLSRGFILSDGTLHPVSLPNLDTLPSTVIPPLRGVVSVVLDDDELDWEGPGSEDRSAELTVIVVRRKGLGIYRLGTRLLPIKEIPLPSPPTVLAMSTAFLCAAIPSSNTYSLIDLHDASLTEVLPVSQMDSLEFEVNANVVVVPGENEFLVTSYTGASTMGVFLNGQGDPVRGTIEWPEHPVSIAIESGYIIALLRGHTICIHSLNDLDKPVQIVTLEPGFDAFTLSYTPYGVSVRDNIRDERMSTSRMLLMTERLQPSTAPVVPMGHGDGSSDGLRPPEDDAGRTAGAAPYDEPEGGSGLTPPSSPPMFSRQPIAPVRSSSLLQIGAPDPRHPFSTFITETLLVGPNGIQSLAPTPAIPKLEELCREGKVEEAVTVVDEERRKGRRGEIDADKSTHQVTLRFLHLFLACHLLIECAFDKAADYFLRGKLDPRLLVRIFPELRGKTIGSAEEVEIYDGLRQVLQDTPSVDELFDTHMSLHPNTSRSDLQQQAEAMLTEVLRKTRISRRKGGGSRGVDSRKIDIVIDTTLSKLLANLGPPNELLALLAGPNDIVMSELEPFLTQRPFILSTVMRKQGKLDRELDLLREIAEKPGGDALCPEPLSEFASQLAIVKDPDLFRRNVLWLAGKDIDRAMEILSSQDSQSGIKLDDAALVEDLKKIDTKASSRYVEQVVVVKRSPNRALHQQLLQQLLDEVLQNVQDDGIKYHLEELHAEYQLLPDAESFPVFLADIAPSSSIKNLRLKLMLFLQGSPFYDREAVAKRLETVPLLAFEYAIVLGRLHRDRKALELLARDIGDAVSSQTYCTQGGEILPPRVAHQIASHMPELAEWATLNEVGRHRRGTIDAQAQEGLVMDLLGVYMRDGSQTAKQTAALLNAQSMHLDVLKVLALVPPEWPVDVVSSFFERSLRRQLHDRASWQVQKAISAGQNLQISEEYLDRINRIPPTFQLKPSPGLSVPDEGSIAEKEYERPSEPGSGEVDEKSGEKDGRGKEGFFSPQVVDKELRDLRLDRVKEQRG